MTFRLVPHSHPLLILSLLHLETDRLLDFQWSAGITSTVQWNLCPVIFGVDARLFIANKRFTLNSPVTDVGCPRLAEPEAESTKIAIANRRNFLSQTSLSPVKPQWGRLFLEKSQK